MDYAAEWKSIKNKVTFISVIELVLLVFAFSLSLQAEGPIASHIAKAVIPAALLIHALVLYKLWRCPHCNRHLKFWQRLHMESVSSLSGCSSCGAKFK